MEKVEKCDFCGHRNFKFLFYGFDKNLKISGKFRLVKCIKCGLIFINPRPSFNELKRHYPKDEYYSLSKIKTKEDSKKTRFKIFLYNIYFNPETKKNLLRVLFSPFKFLVRGAKIILGKKLLDVGSGSGQFLYEMKHFGLETYGVEPGDFDKKSAKKYGLNIKKTDLIKAKYPSNFFDIVTIYHVLEHVDNPSEILKEIKRILKKGGTLIIGVPNTNSLAQRLFRSNWISFDVPRHLFDFSEEILIKYLKKNSFKIKKIRYNSRPNQFSVSMVYLLNINSKGVIVKMLDIIFLPLTYLVNLFRIGDQIEIYCEK